MLDDQDRIRLHIAVFVDGVHVRKDALAYPLSRGLYATHDTIRQALSSFVALGVVVAVSSSLVGSMGILAIPLGYATGMAVKDVVLGFFLVRRLGRLSLGGLNSPN